MNLSAARNVMSGARIVVTGACGMLASDIVRLLEQEKSELILTDRVKTTADSRNRFELDICDFSAVNTFLTQTKPQLIINCAAYTKVDDAEREQFAAFEVNSMGPANLAKIARKLSVPLVHVSTDYVYGGNSLPRHTPYNESDPLAPCGIYGQSKRFGDELVQAILPEDHLIVRTSWLHGISGPSFVASMLRLAKERDSLKVVNDQVGAPTWSGWLAETIVKLIKKEARGVFNAASRDCTTWYDFAREIYRQANLPVKVLPQTTEELNRPAPRPRYSVLDVTKIESLLGEKCISWKEGLSAHLHALGVVG